MELDRRLISCNVFVLGDAYLEVPTYLAEVEVGGEASSEVRWKGRPCCFYGCVTVIRFILLALRYNLQSNITTNKAIEPLQTKHGCAAGKSYTRPISRNSVS